MPRRGLLASFLLCAVALPQEILEHDLELKIDPAAGTFESVDRILVRGPTVLDLPVVSGIKAEPSQRNIPGGKHEVTVHYRGKLPAEIGAAEAGAIGPDFVGLRWGFYTAAGASPFKVQISVPLPHRAVCQGRRVAESEKDGLYRVTYEAGAHTRRIIVATAPWRVTEEAIDGTSCRSYRLGEERDLLEPLRTALPKARGIFGSLPDGRFDIVEVPFASELVCANFSFVGPGPMEPGRLSRDLIRVWIGNFVYGDPERGNWWDGLTDFLAAEPGAAIRRRTVYRYSLRVPPGQDQPLHARVWPERDEILRGKSSMVFHMLARRLGRPLFLKALRHTIETRAGRRLGFAEIGAALGEGANWDLATWFEPWISRPGGPTVETGTIKVSGDRIVGTIVQSHEGPAYPLRVPIRVRTAAGTEELSVRSASKESAFMIETKAEPRRLEIDPEFHLFRIIPRERAAPCLDATLTAHRTVGIGNAQTLARWKIESTESGLTPDAAVLAVELPESVREEVLALARRQEGTLSLGESGFEFRGTTYDRPGDAILLSFARPQSPGFPVTLFHGDAVPDLEEFGTDGWVIFRDGEPIARGDFGGDRPSVVQVTEARKGEPDSLLRDLLFLTDARHRGRRAGTNEAYKLANELRGRLFKAGVKVLPWPPVSIPTGRLVGERKITILDGEEKFPLPQHFFPFHRSASPDLPAVFKRVVEHPAEEVTDALVLLPEDSGFELAQAYAEKGAAVVAVVATTFDFRARGADALWEGAMP
ncbi:MAG: M1 aminopeptidase family protein, partial [Planctomycetota bacterium]